ncbi:MAG: hypothetical protein HY390_00970 [Deltaproteobacteria bacterium]|nr:hypothetical protein [Deltaproteobacteria bacterium]
MPNFLQNLKDQWSLDQLRQSKLFAPWVIRYEALPADQKQLANVAIIAGLVLVLLSFVFLGNSKVTAIREEIDAKQTTLRELSKYEAQFTEQLVKLQELERSTKRIQQDFSLLTTLEKFAQASQIGRESIESISPKQLPSGDYFIETEATVQLVRVPLKHLTDYFYRIESSPFHLKLKEAHMKPRFDNPDFLNVTFIVSSFKPKDNT